MYSNFYYANLFMIFGGVYLNYLMCKILRAIICNKANKVMKGDAYLPTFAVIADIIGLISYSVIYYTINFIFFEINESNLVILIGFTVFKYFGYIMAGLEKDSDLKKVIDRIFK